VTLLGYCFGGILSLIYAAGHRGPQLRNLISAATPFDSSKASAFPGVLNPGGSSRRSSSTRPVTCLRTSSPTGSSLPARRPRSRPT
jgi:hypothetical protein